MPESSLLVLLLAAVAVAIVLLVLLLLRKPERALEAALREEQRDGRGELRQQLEGLSGRTDQRLALLREALAADAPKARTEGADLQQRFRDGLGPPLQQPPQRHAPRPAQMQAA